MDVLHEIKRRQERVRELEGEVSAEKDTLWRTVASAHDEYGVPWRLLASLLGVSRQYAERRARGRAK